MIYSGGTEPGRRPTHVANPKNRRVLWGILLVFLFAYFHHPSPGSGVDARLDLAMALVDPGSLNIDAYRDNTHDMTEVGGHFYSDKPPLPSLLGAPVYAAARAAARLFGRALSFRAAGYAVTLATATLLSLAVLLLLFRHLAAYAPAGPRLFAVTACALGTLALPYAILFFSHAFAAFFCLAAFVFAFRRVRGEGGTGAVALAGLFAGLAILSEYPTGLIALFLLGYLLTRARRPAEIAAYLAPAFLLPAVALGVFNALSFGSPFHLGYAKPVLPMYGEAMSHGLFGVTLPSLRALGYLLFSPSRGLFFLAPVLLLAVPGLVMMIRDRAWRREGVLIAAIACGHLLFNAAYHQPGGGTSYGPRHLVPIVPFLIVPAYVFAASSGRAWRALAAFLAVVSVGITFAATAIEPLWQEVIRHPLAEFLPALAATRDQLDNLGMRAFPAFPWNLEPALVALVVVLALALADLFAAPAGDARRRGALAPACVGLLVVAAYAGSAAFVHTDPGVLQQALGNHYSGNGEYARAVAAYEQAAGLRNDPYIRYYQGRAYLALGLIPEAAASYREVLRIAPDFPEAERVRGLIGKLDDVARSGQRERGD